MDTLRAVISFEFDKIPSVVRRMRFATTFLALLVLTGCASETPYRMLEVEDLAADLAARDPESPEAVFDFAARRSMTFRLDLPGHGAEMAEALLDEEGPWYEKLLFAYLLALDEDPEGFAAMVELLDRGGLAPDVEDGLAYCVIKCLGMTEKDYLLPVPDVELSQKAWREYRGEILKLGVHRWRLAHLEDLVGRPDGEPLRKAASWLKWKLTIFEVPFLADLLGRGDAACDEGLLEILETVTLTSFGSTPGAGGALSVEERVRVFRDWFAARAETSPLEWLEEGFAVKGFDTTAFLTQASLPRIEDGLFARGDDEVLLRHHTLYALNLICGFHVDRRVLFMDEAVRREAQAAFRAWREDLGMRLRYE